MVNKIVAPVLCCNIMSFIVGIGTTWSSPIVEKLSSIDHLDDNPFGRLIDADEKSSIGSIMALGGICGTLFGLVSDKIGRKWTLLALAIPALVAYLILAFAKCIGLYYLGRFLAGLATGGTYVLVAMYVAEISEDSNRGSFGALLNTFVACGSLFSYCVGSYISILWFNVICAILPALFIVLFFFLGIESPHYYMKKGDESSSEAALRKLRNGDCDKELIAIREASEKARGGSIMDIFRSKGLRKAMITSLALIFFQQFSGIMAVLSYAQTIFKASGSDIDSAVSSIIVGAVQVGTSFTTPLLADCLGRRVLFMISAIGMLVSEVPLGIYFYLKDDGTDLSSVGWLPVACLAVYIITYNTAFAGLPWAVMGELFPPNVKSFASALTAIFCGALGLLIMKFFESVSNAIGMGELFWIFAACCCLALLFVSFYLIETKGKSLQEIQDILVS